jgi:hypothetical protein
LTETRQQLDELETLIRRMLAIPADPPGEAAATPIPLPEAVEPPSLDPVAPPLPLVERVDHGQGEEHVGPHFEAILADNAAPDEMACEGESPMAEIHPAFGVGLGRAPTEKTEDSTTRAEDPPAISTKAPAWRPRTTPWLIPLVALNSCFDRIALRFGRLGAALVQERGKNVLGWGGLVLIASALFWAFLDWVFWAW